MQCTWTLHTVQMGTPHTASYNIGQQLYYMPEYSQSVSQPILGQLLSASKQHTVARRLQLKRGKPMQK